MGQVFISYSSRDRDRVAELVSVLKQQGYSIWWDDDLTPGGDWDMEIQQALEQSRTVVVVWSEHAMQSREVRAEATYALNENKLLPLRIDPVKIWARYNIVQYEDVLQRPPDRDPNWPAILGHLRRKLGLSSAPDSATGAGQAAADAVPPAPRAVSDAPVLPPGIAASALLMSASGLSLIAWLVVPLVSKTETMIPVFAAVGFAALGIAFAMSALLRPYKRS